MEPIRQEIKSFVHGCQILLSLGSLEQLSSQESDLIEQNLSEVEKLFYGNEPELYMRDVDAA